MSVVVTSFSNDESVRPQTLLKTEHTIDILIDQVHKFQTAILKNTCERLLLFHKKHSV